jgi:hypothetical protein
MTTSASAELNVIKSVQINSSSQSIAGTLRAPKSSLLAMAVSPLCPWQLGYNAEPSLRVPRHGRPASDIFAMTSRGFGFGLNLRQWSMTCH